MRSNINLNHGDCMEAMASMEDNQYDLAIVDPMYDLSENELCPGSKITKCGTVRKHIEQARKLSKQEIINTEYFTELKRVSKHQIIWGINYFCFAGEIKGRIVWDKQNDGSTFSNCELASCSVHNGTRIFRYLWNGFVQNDMKNKEKRIHAFQKPVALYEWILDRYAKSGHKILDTHGGSMSIAIACHDLKFDLDLWELDEDYYKAGKERFENYTMQGQFDFKEDK